MDANPPWYVALAALLGNSAAKEFSVLVTRDAYAKLKGRVQSILGESTAVSELAPSALAPALESRAALEDPEVVSLLVEVARGRDAVIPGCGVRISDLSAASVRISGIRVQGRGLSIERIESAGAIDISDIDLR